jgi:PncC family amidohydrolase
MGRTEHVNDGRATPEQIIQLLVERRETLAVAESCTGGLIGHLITEVPGCSDVFLGGVIVYANSLKEKIGVPAETLASHGAVSGETAEAMASGIRRWVGADYGIAVTGIAGPGGATETKPVGLVYIGVAGGSGVEVEEHRFGGERSWVKLEAAEAALALLWRRLGRGTA